VIDILHPRPPLIPVLWNVAEVSLVLLPIELPAIGSSKWDLFVFDSKPSSPPPFKLSTALKPSVECGYWPFGLFKATPLSSRHKEATLA
jgi:hypothetical protein